MCLSVCVCFRVWWGGGHWVSKSWDSLWSLQGACWTAVPVSDRVDGAALIPLWSPLISNVSILDFNEVLGWLCTNIQCDSRHVKIKHIWKKKRTLGKAKESQQQDHQEDRPKLGNTSRSEINVSLQQITDIAHYVDPSALTCLTITIIIELDKLLHFATCSNNNHRFITFWPKWTRHW